jgi:RNA polymerase sigma-70 factor (ECF subfamily)
MLSREQLQGLFRYCYCLTTDRRNAEDLLQTSLEKWLRLDKTLDHSHAYIRKIIRNQFVDDCRRNQILAFDSIEEGSPILLDDICIEELEIQHNLIEHVFGLLNTAEREVLYLWAVYGYTASEISVELMQPRGTILSRLHRIKQKVANASDNKEEQGSEVSL